jgi:O-methyltransferase
MTRATIAIDPAMQAYILANSPPEHPELARLREETRKMPRAQMQIAPEQGYFLSLLVKLTGAKRVLELGTFTGYSSLAMALALPADGKIVTCDLSADWSGMAVAAWKRADVDAKVELRLGNALATLQTMQREGLSGSFDMAFIDANKEDYDAYYEAALILVKKGGLIVLDNMFRDGRVADPSITDPSVTCIAELNAKIARDERGDRALIPVGDGMMMVRKR